MASTLVVRISVERDGVPIPGFPYIRRLQADEAQAFDVQQAVGSGYLALPADRLDEIQGLVYTADQTTSIRFQNQSDMGLKVNAGGCVVLLDVDLDSSPTTNVRIDNTSLAIVELRGVALGT